jgi:hypothetical protein
MTSHPSLVIHPKSFTSCINFQLPVWVSLFQSLSIVFCFALLCFALPIDIMLFFALFTGATFVSFYL